jgi:hypothetical protein
MPDSAFTTPEAFDNLDVMDHFLDDGGIPLEIGMVVQILHHNVIAGACGVIVGLDTLNDNCVPRGDDVIWVRLDKLSSLLALHPARVRYLRKTA